MTTSDSDDFDDYLNEKPSEIGVTTPLSNVTMINCSAG